MNITLDNCSHFDERLIREIMDHIGCLKLKAGVYFRIDPIWSDLETPGSEDARIPWDGTAYDELEGYPERVVHIVISPACSVPLIYAPNRVLEGSYLRTTYIETLEHLLVYMMAHEFRHCWQWDYPKTRRLGLDQDESSEQDCDIFAIIKLNEWITKNLGN